MDDKIILKAPRPLWVAIAQMTGLSMLLICMWVILEDLLKGNMMTASQIIGFFVVAVLPYLILLLFIPQGSIPRLIINNRSSKITLVSGWGKKAARTISRT